MEDITPPDSPLIELSNVNKEDIAISLTSLLEDTQFPPTRSAPLTTPPASLEAMLYRQCEVCGICHPEGLHCRLPSAQISPPPSVAPAFECPGTVPPEIMQSKFPPIIIPLQTPSVAPAFVNQEALNACANINLVVDKPRRRGRPPGSRNLPRILNKNSQSKTKKVVVSNMQTASENWKRQRIANAAAISPPRQDPKGKRVQNVESTTAMMTATAVACLSYTDLSNRLHHVDENISNQRTVDVQYDLIAEIRAAEIDENKKASIIASIEQLAARDPQFYQAYMRGLTDVKRGRIDKDSLPSLIGQLLGGVRDGEYIKSSLDAFQQIINAIHKPSQKEPEQKLSVKHGCRHALSIFQDVKARFPEKFTDFVQCLFNYNQQIRSNMRAFLSSNGIERVQHDLYRFLADEPKLYESVKQFCDFPVDQTDADLVYKITPCITIEDDEVPEPEPTTDLRCYESIPPSRVCLKMSSSTLHDRKDELTEILLSIATSDEKIADVIQNEVNELVKQETNSQKWIGTLLHNLRHVFKRLPQLHSFLMDLVKAQAQSVAGTEIENGDPSGVTKASQKTKQGTYPNVKGKRGKNQKPENSYKKHSHLKKKPVCSGRNNLCDSVSSVLNDELYLLSFPVFKIRPKHQHDLSVYAFEDALHEVDILLHRNFAAIILLDEIYKKMQGMSQKELDTYQLDEYLGGENPLSKVAIQLLFNENRVLLGLQKFPALFIPPVLEVLKDQDQEWIGLKGGWKNLLDYNINEENSEA